MAEESKNRNPIMIFGVIVCIGILIIIASVLYKGGKIPETPPAEPKHLPTPAVQAHTHENMNMSEELPPLPANFKKYEDQLPQIDEKTIQVCMEKLSTTVLTPETVKDLLAKVHKGNPMAKMQENWTLEIATELAKAQEGGKFSSLDELKKSVSGVIYQEMRKKIRAWNQTNLVPEMRPNMEKVMSEIMSGPTSEKLEKFFNKITEEGQNPPSEEELAQINKFIQSRNRQILHPQLQEKLQPLIETEMMEGGYGQAVIQPLIQPGGLDNLLKKLNDEGKLKTLIK